jgi:ribose transport system ATP-binding protein
LLQVHGIRKSFPGVQALDGVSMEVGRGEIVALAGENGAGKSTLMNILSGVLQPDEGEMRFEGRPIQPRNPREAQALGIGIVHQELSLMTNLTVAENIFCGREPLRAGGLVDWPRMWAAAATLLDGLDLRVDPRTRAGDLSVAQQQVVEIAKALSLDATLLILDEPTSALADHEVEVLFGLLRQLQQRGVGVIYITHKLKEIFQIADRAVVLKDGRYVGALAVKDATPEKIISMMVGRELSQMYPAKAARLGDVLLELRGFRGVSFGLRRGEILGLAGLMGAGRTELARAIFGADPAAGEVLLEGRPLQLRSPADAIRAGIAYLPEDRRALGLFLGMSVTENIIAATLRKFSRRGFVDRRRTAAAGGRYVERLRIRTPSLGQRVMNLSGGNQQKVLLAKWLEAGPKVLIVNEPTRGIDVGAKAEIHALLRDLAGGGIGVVVISSELPELLGLCDRILAMHEGRVTGEFAGEQATEEAIMAKATGH